MEEAVAGGNIDRHREDAEGIVNMKYFFEDWEGSALFESLRVPYGKRGDIVFTEGSGNLAIYVVEFRRERGY